MTRADMRCSEPALALRLPSWRPVGRVAGSLGVIEYYENIAVVRHLR
jgi:hypothetical protein